MRILLISSAFSGLTQRFYTELEDAGYTVSVELHLGDTDKLTEGVTLFQPDLIVCPYLTRRLPEAIYQHYKCLIVHPGIKGDRGPSSLDWAIQRGLTEWGVTILEADAEMDAGAVWATKTFALRQATKSSLFNREVTQAAVDCLWEVLTYLDAPDFKPEALDYDNPDVKGRLQPLMKQADRAIDWKNHTTAEIVRRIQAADGRPGLLDNIYGMPFYLFNAHAEPRLTGRAGDIIAVANQAICRATVDGAVWIGHLQAKLPSGNGIKLPASLALNGLLRSRTAGLRGLFHSTIKCIDIDYTVPGRQLPCQEIWYEIDGEAAYLYFPCHNGGMSTKHCRLLLSVYRHLATLDCKAIVLMGGEDYWSNGIHLNHIEAADDAADESWDNINAIDDLVQQIITTLDKLTIAAVAGNAGAGGAILAIAPDLVLAREGVVFNPHYKNMGGLYGSEYWTYLLPKRVGPLLADQLADQCLPVSAKKAWQLGLVDLVLDREHAIFAAQVKRSVNNLLADPGGLNKCLAQKANRRCADEAAKPLASYRKSELIQMHANMYGGNHYHQARQDFVYKKAPAKTPDNIAKHRQFALLNNILSSNTTSHLAWQDSYGLGDDKIDRQHKEFFRLADDLLDAAQKGAIDEAVVNLYQHIKEHFAEEEGLMKQVGFHRYKSHVAEHNVMLENLLSLDKKVQNHDWNLAEVKAFVDNWTKHILGSDMLFNQHWKEMYKFCV